MSLWKTGTLVQVNAGVWSMSARLSARDLEKDESELPDFIKLGHKRLFDRKLKNGFDSIINNVRRLLSDVYGFDFFLTGAYFVPNSSLETLRPQLEQAQLEFSEKVEKFLSDYETFKTNYLEVHADYEELLKPYYPDVEEVRSKFYFNIWCYTVDSTATPLANFEINQDVYTEWITEAINSLRASAREVAENIEKALDSEKVDGRTLRQVSTLIKRLTNLDLLGDTQLLNAAKQLKLVPNLEQTRKLKELSKPVSPVNVRKLLID